MEIYIIVVSYFVKSYKSKIGFNDIQRSCSVKNVSNSKGELNSSLKSCFSIEFDTAGCGCENPPR